MTATIAAEMGETVHGDDHYRVLFILGIVLFIDHLRHQHRRRSHHQRREESEQSVT